MTYDNFKKIHEKFRVIREETDKNNYDILTHFFGTMLIECKKGNFDSFWKRIHGEEHLRFYNPILEQKGLPYLTIEEVRQYFNTAQKSLEKSASEI